MEFPTNSPLEMSINNVWGFYCLQEGHVKISHVEDGRSKTVRIGGPGDILGFGLKHAFQAGKRVVHSIGKCRACFIPLAKFETLYGKIPTLNSEMIKMLVRMIEASEKKIVGLATHNVKRRVASILLLLNERFGVESEHGSRLDVKIDRKTISELAGTVIESTARVLTELENEGMILRRGRTIYILDLPALYKLVEII